MSDLGKYYIFSSLLFLIDMISNIIFYSSYKSCGISSNASSIFLIMILVNSFIFFSMFIDGVLINFYSNKELSDLNTLGFILRWLGIFTKFLPAVIKLLHFFKIFAFFLLTIFTVIGVLGDLSISNYSIETCGDKTEDSIIKSYQNNIIIFYGIEAFSLCFTLCILGMIKSYINIEGYLYTPLSPDAGCCKKTFIKTFGP